MANPGFSSMALVKSAMAASRSPFCRSWLPRVLYSLAVVCAFSATAESRTARNRPGRVRWDSFMTTTLLSISVPDSNPNRVQLAAGFGNSASEASSALSSAAMVSSVSSPMFEMRNVAPLSLP